MRATLKGGTAFLEGVAGNRRAPNVLPENPIAAVRSRQH